MKNSFYLAAIVFLAITVSCNQTQKPVIEHLLPEENGDFRSIELRSSLAEVKQKEKISPKNEEEDYLFYEFPLNAKGEYYTLGYSFNEKGLYEILLDVFLEKPEDALQVYSDIRENFISRYGKPLQEDETTLVWTAACKRSEEVEITLSDESASYNSGKISLSFYDLSY